MMEAAEVDNPDRYKSYMQRRRVGSAPNEAIVMAEAGARNSEPISSYDRSIGEEAKTGSRMMISPMEDFLKEDSRDNSIWTANPMHNNPMNKNPIHNNNFAPVTSLKRADPGLYKKLYGQNSKSIHASPYGSPHHSYGSLNHAEIEDNHTTVLAVKIIKQALACFAVLAIIVLMQQRSDMDGVLGFIKKQVVESHIEPKSLLTSVENVWKQCSQFLGGSP